MRVMFSWKTNPTVSVILTMNRFYNDTKIIRVLLFKCQNGQKIVIDVLLIEIIIKKQQSIFFIVFYLPEKAGEIDF